MLKGCRWGKQEEGEAAESWANAVSLEGRRDATMCTRTGAPGTAAPRMRLRIEKIGNATLELLKKTGSSHRMCSFAFKLIVWLFVGVVISELA